MAPFWRILKIDPGTPEGLRLIAFLGLTFTAGILGGPVSSLLSVYVDSQLHQPPTFTSSLLAFQLATTGVFAVLSGAVADSLGQKRALVLGLCGIPLATTIFLFHSFWVLAVMVVGLGVTNALQSIGGQSYLLAASPKAKLGGFTALYYLGNTLGGALGNAIAGPVADRWGFTNLGAAEFVVSLIFLALALTYLPEAPAVKEGRSTPAVELLVAYQRLIRQRDVALICVIRLLPTCFYGTTSLLVPLLVYRLSHSIAVASLYATASLVTSMTAQQVVGRLIDRFGPFGPIRVLGAALPIIAAGTALAAESLPALAVAGICATATLWCISTVIPALVREVAPRESHGRALGLVHLIWSTGMLIGTISGGNLVIVNPHLPFAAFAALNLLTFPAAVALTQSRRALTSETIEVVQ